MELTYAGEAFLKHAKIMEQELENLNHEMSDITGQHRGVLHIGIGFTRSHAIMPALIAKFQQTYPNVEIVLKEATNREVQIALEKGECDLAISRRNRKAGEIKSELFYEEQVYLILSRELLSSLRIDKTTLQKQLKKGNLHALKDCPFVMCSQDDIVGEMERDFLKHSGILPQVKATSDNIETLLTLCNMSVGACLCPDKLYEITFSENEYEQLEVFSLRKTSQVSYSVFVSYRQLSVEDDCRVYQNCKACTIG